MRFQWPLAAAVAIAVCGHAQAAPLYTLEASAIVSVPVADRISATHLFQRELSILTASRSQLPYISLTSDVRGRLFVTYDDKPPTDDRVFAKITIAGNSESAVGLIEFPKEVETIYEPLTLQPPLSIEIKDTETMLIDIKLYKKNSLKDFNIASGEGVLLENVVYASPNDSSIDTVFGWGSGSLFVSDPSLQLGGVDLYAYSPNGTFQAEVGQINATADDALVNLPRGGTVTIVADQVRELRVSSTDEAGRANSKLCVSSKTAVNVTYDVGEYIDLNAGNRTVLPSGVVCTKLPLPERATTQIGGRANTSSEGTKDAAKGATSSAISVVASVGVVVAFMVAALM